VVGYPFSPTLLVLKAVRHVFHVFDGPLAAFTMFNLIRRISYGVIPRPDRPWADDGEYAPFFIKKTDFKKTDFACAVPSCSLNTATSNAPQTGKKRRLSSTDREQDPDAEESAKKKVRGESVASSVADSQVASPQVETAEVKFVTQGVKQVEITDEEPAAVAPAEVPLPEEQEGELDEPAAATPPQEAQEEYADDNSDDIASSTNGDAEESTTGTVVAEESEPLDKDKEEGVVPAVVKDDHPSISPVIDPEQLKKPVERPDDHTAEKEDALPHDD
jgi:hypothetical protein